MTKRLSRSTFASACWFRAMAVAFSLTLLCAAFAAPAAAQNFNSDARIIGMGGSDQSNDSTSMAEGSKGYKSIGLPIGLFQLWQHRDAFRADDQTKFNPLLAIEDLANPLHYTFGRKSETEGQKLVSDIVNGNLSQDLMTYKGFVPKSPLVSQGIFSPDFGKTIRMHKAGNLYQGIFIGAGPYLTAGTNFAVDQGLLDAWSGVSSGIPTDSTLHFDDTTSAQAALSVTGGYRGRFASPKGLKSKNGSGRDGVYVSANYHYLRGFHYDADVINVRFDTDSAGLIGSIPTEIPVDPIVPVVVDRITSTTGRGRSVDFGTNIVTGPWDFNFGADGIGNQIVWEQLKHEQHTLSALSDGLAFDTTSLAAPGVTATVKLPVRYSGGATFRARKWTARGQLVRGVNVAPGLNGREFHVGGEYHLGIVDVRGGGRYSNKIFNPMGGAGVSITEHFGIDGAVFSTTANAQRDRRTAVALSLRFR